MSLASVGLRTYARGSKLSSSAQLRGEECHAPAETTTLCLGKSLRVTWTFVLLLSLQGISLYRRSTKISPPLTLALDETLVCGILAWRGSCRLVEDLHDARRQEPSHAKVLLGFQSNCFAMLISTACMARRDRQGCRSDHFSKYLMPLAPTHPWLTMAVDKPRDLRVEIDVRMHRIFARYDTSTKCHSGPLGKL